MKRFALFLAAALGLLWMGLWSYQRGSDPERRVGLTQGGSEAQGRLSEPDLPWAPESVGLRPATELQSSSKVQHAERFPVLERKAAESVHFDRGIPGLDLPGTLEVQVLNPQGTPRQEWAQVEVLGNDWAQRGSPLLLGSSRVSSLPLGEPLTVRVTPPSGWNAISKSIAALAGNEPHRRVTITLEPPRPRLRGAVVDAAGLRVKTPLHLAFSDRVSIGFATDRAGEFDFWIPTEHSGAAELRRGGASMLADDVATLSIDSLGLGESQDLGVVQLQKERLLLGGRFVLADGTPVGLSRFSLMHELEPGRWVPFATGQSDSEGRVEVPWKESHGAIFLQPTFYSGHSGRKDPFQRSLNEESGRHTGPVSLSDQDYYLAQPTHLTPGQTQVTLIFRPAVTLSGSIEWDHDKPPGVTLRCTQGPGMIHEIVDWRPKRQRPRPVDLSYESFEPERNWRDSGNRFEFQGLQPGLATLEVWHRGKRVFLAEAVPVDATQPRPAAIQGIALSLGE